MAELSRERSSKNRRLHRLMPAAIILLLLAAVLAAIRCFLPPAQTVFAVSARTETVEVRVRNPQAAAFGLQHVLLLRADNTRICLSDVAVAPRFGASVQYARFGLDPVTITIDDAAAQLTSRQSISEPDWAGLVQPPVQLLLDPANGNCPASKLVRLPLFGSILAVGDETSFGSDPLSPRLVLLSGTIRMLVRAIILHVPGWGEVGGGGPEGDELFAVEQTVLPPGSVVRRALDSDGTPADWWGFVDVMFGEADQRGLQVEASSHARSVALELPAAVGSNGGAEDRRSLALDVVQRWSNDPTLRLVALLWATLGLFATIGGTLWELSRKWSERATD